MLGKQYLTSCKISPSQAGAELGKKKTCIIRLCQKVSKVGSAAGCQRPNAEQCNGMQCSAVQLKPVSIYSYNFNPS